MSNVSKKLPRGVLTVDDLKARCVVDPVSHCWLWQGATSDLGRQPRIWTFDHERVEKRAMSGPLAAWNIAFGEAPRPGHLVFRCCQRNLCLNPAHLRQAASKKEIGLHIQRAKTRVGTHVEQRRENVRAAWRATGCKLIDAAIVREIRQASASTTNRKLAALHNVSEGVVSNIRRGKSYREVTV